MASYSVNWSAPIAAVAGTILVGQCLVPNASGQYVVGTTANRTSFGRCDGLAATTGDSTHPVTLIEAGPIENALTGLGVGLASWVRVSSTGVLERVTTPSGSDDVVGWCETTGRLHSVWGTLTATIVNGGGSGFTAGGDLTGTSSSQTVAKVNGATYPAAGALTTGTVPRVTGASAVAYGAVDLANASAVTGVLPTGNVATTLTSKTLTTPVVNGQTLGAAVAISALAIDWTLGTVFTKTLSAGANAFTFSNQASGMTIVVRLTGAASTVTWPGGGSAVKWAGGAAPTQTASGIDVYTFVHDGTNIYGSVVQAMA